MDRIIFDTTTAVKLTQNDFRNMPNTCLRGHTFDARHLDKFISRPRTAKSGKGTYFKLYKFLSRTYNIQISYIDYQAYSRFKQRKNSARNKEKTLDVLGTLRIE